MVLSLSFLICKMGWRRLCPGVCPLGLVMGWHSSLTCSEFTTPHCLWARPQRRDCLLFEGPGGLPLAQIKRIIRANKCSGPSDFLCNLLCVTNRTKLQGRAWPPFAFDKINPTGVQNRDIRIPMPGSHPHLSAQSMNTTTAWLGSAPPRPTASQMLGLDLGHLSQNAC